MITGLRTPARRTVANRPVPTPTVTSRNAHALRSALGPGFQSGVSDRLVQQALRR